MQSMSLPLCEQPVGLYTTHIESLLPQDSIRAVARDLAELGVPALPIAGGEFGVGSLSEKNLARAVLDGIDLDLPCETIATKDCPVFQNSTPVRVVLESIMESESEWAMIVDQNQNPIGFFFPSRAIDQRFDRSLHGRVGGMATPFGVYLTNGSTHGGASLWAVFSTGALMFVLFALASIPSVIAQNSLSPEIVKSPIFSVLAQIVPFVLFMFTLRILPLSKTHGAEHMVVHALEKGETLEPDVVSRMPRVHPRCGTNLAMAAMVFLGIMGFGKALDEDLRLLVALLVTVILWQPLGNFVQHFFTTSTPGAKEIVQGIEASKELLLRTSTSSNIRPTVLRKLALSGLFHVMAGAMAVALLLALIYEVLHVPPSWRVS